MYDFGECIRSYWIASYLTCTILVLPLIIVMHTVIILIPLNDATGSVFTTSRIYDIETNVKSQRVYLIKKLCGDRAGVAI